jgi:quercetin dioxygenase-like cupin family protein
MDEARLEHVVTGLTPVTDGWFVVNARDAAWIRHPTFGLQCVFETVGPIARSRDGVEPLTFEQLGIRLHVLSPGQPSTLYHEEPGNQEDFLVLEGECRAVVEGEERHLRRWDFVHCPPGTKHSFTGAGDGPCVLLGVGARRTREIRYLPTPLAESVAEETASGAEAYAPYGHWKNDGASPLADVQ